MFHYVDNRLFAEDVAVEDIAREFGTPCYVYSRSILERNFVAYREAFGERAHEICYAVKANGNLAIIDVLARLGAAFDIVSYGELERVRAAGADVKKITFAGVGKSRAELDAALAAEIRCFNVESIDELELLNEVAIDRGVVAPVAIRVNPDVDAKTHPYIATGLNENKFGIPMSDAVGVYQRIANLAGLKAIGIACHIGSQLMSASPIVDAAKRVMSLVAALRDSGIEVEHIDIGGGLGISYDDEQPPAVEEYVRQICDTIDARYEITVEPGRSIAGPAGMLVTQVQYIKETPAKTFAICDAAMTELIRPALYQAYHDVMPVNRSGNSRVVDIVGPVCETGDFLARDRDLVVSSGALLSVMDCGAYAFVMASNYNARPRVAEIMVDGSNTHLIRERETIEALFRGEHCLP